MRFVESPGLAIQYGGDEEVYSNFNEMSAAANARLILLAITMSSWSTPYATHNPRPLARSNRVLRDRSSVSPVVHAFLSCGTLAAVVQTAAARPIRVAKVIITENRRLEGRV
jgi:hypothetical protein